MDYGKYGITVNAYAPGTIETPLRECIAVFLCVESYFRTSVQSIHWMSTILS